MRIMINVDEFPNGENSVQADSLNVNYMDIACYRMGELAKRSGLTEAQAASAFLAGYWKADDQIISRRPTTMEIRKFIVELHTDGSITWAEYSEPREVGYTDVARKCRQRAKMLSGVTSDWDYMKGLYTAYSAIAQYCENRIK